MRMFLSRGLLSLMLSLLPAHGRTQDVSFYIVENGAQAGPFGSADLRAKATAGLLNPDTLVWTDGMANWTPAQQVPQIAVLLNATPTAPPPPPPPQQNPGSAPNTAPGAAGTGQGSGGQTMPSAAQLDQLAQLEQQDFGVPATTQLHNGAMHGATPNSIPGGQVITTKGLLELVQSGMQYRLFDVLGGNSTLPGALSAVKAAQGGSFGDNVQTEFRQYLQQVTQGEKSTPLVFYCSSPQCWMSYNASLRAINLGYANVLWYRGGIEAWQSIGMPTRPAGG